MGEEAPAAAAVDMMNESNSSSKPWHSYISQDLLRTVQESTDSALRSARSFQYCSSLHLRTLQDFMPKIKAQYREFDEYFFRKIKDELVTATEHPAIAGGIGIAAVFLLIPGPRRFLFRQTLGRLQSEEAKFSRAEKNVKELSMSVDLMKKEGKKLLERAALAEKDMLRGQSDLMDAGNQIRSVAKTVYKVEAEATDLMDVLRHIPGREAIKLRAEVASMASHLRQQRTAIDKRIVKLSDLGVPV